MKIENRRHQRLSRFIIGLILLISIGSTASYAQFGKNKVQYEKFTWKYIQSTHYDIYYNEGSKYLAEFTAITAEQALSEYRDLINYTSEGRSAIIVYNTHNEFQQTNAVSSYMPEGVGGVTELYKNRVIIPFQGDYAMFHHVIRHELIHSVINYMFYGGTYQTAIQTQGIMLPIWMNEGLAEYGSMRGLNTETDMFIRDLVLNDELPPLERMNGYLAYRGGQIFYWYIAEKYGKDKIAALLNKLRFSRSMDAAFEEIFHKDLEEFSEEFIADIKKLYFPDLPRFENPKDFATRLTDQKKDRTYYNSSPTISPDGNKMAYISAPEGIYAVYVRDIDDKESAEKVVSSMRQQDFEDLNLLTPGISWSPDSKKIAISAKAGGQDAIFIVDAETKKYEKIKLGMKSITSVQWAPDGNRLAFIGSNKLQSDIFIYDINSKALVNLTNDIFTERVPIWSPNSEQLYFISDRGSNTQINTSSKDIKMWNEDVYLNDIYRMTIATQSIERLSNSPEYEKKSIAIAPDNNKLLFTADDNGIGNLYELNITNNSVRPLTNSISGIEQISISQDGSKLLFSAQTNGGIDIYMIRQPLELKIAGDTIPLTELRKKQIQKAQRINEIESAAIAPTASDTQKLEGYGEFDIDFSQQALLQPNSDAPKRVAKTENAPIAANSAYVNDEFIEYDYKIQFSPDVVAGNPGYSTYYGFQGVAQMLFSDKLGDHQIYAQMNIFQDLRNSSFYFAYNHLPGIIDWSFHAYQNAGYVYTDFPVEVQQQTGYGGGYYRYRNIAGGMTVSLPTSMFQRFEAGFDAMYLIKANYSFPEFESDETTFLLAPKVKAVYDNTLWGYYGPNRGFRGYAEILASPKLGDQGVGFATFKTDLRYYIPIGNYFSFALRGAGAVSVGADRQNFFVGGQETWLNYRYKDGQLPIKSPVDFAFMSFQMPMRGWAVGEITGSKFFLGNAEFRFPLFTALIAGPLPILIQGVQGCIFYDAGGAFDKNFSATTTNMNGKKVYQDLLMSTGLGIRANFIGIPWKLDIAWRNEYSGWSKPQYVFSMGLDF